MSKILIIDDKMDNLITISALLKNLLKDCEIITAQSGEEGLKKAILEEPDTILLDIIMPGMDGFEVCKILKTSPKTEHIPVIFLTAIKTDCKSRIRGLELGAEAFLNKPVDEMELVAQIKAMLRIKQAEDRLRFEQAYFLQTIIDTIPVPVFFKDMNGVYMGGNRAFESFSGCPCEELKGKNVYEIFNEDMANKYSEMDRALFNDGGVQVYEGKVSYADSSVHDVIFTKSIFKKSDGTPAGIVGVIMDITERKRSEEEREKLEKQLFNAQKMKAIGTMAGGIAHDFNNILGSILGYTELVYENVPENGNESQYLKQVLIAVNRAKDLIKQILTFSRDADKTEKKPLSISIIVKETLKLMRAIIPSNIEIRYNIENDSSMVLADSTQIHQVITNLCTNAYHAMREKGGIMEIKLNNIDINDREPLCSDLPDGSYVRLTVSDTGCGIDENIIEHIFEPYFTTKEQGEGTGLGLSVVHGIIKNHGGEIKVYSEPGKGTIFYIYLPGVRTSLLSEEQSVKYVSRGNERVLFVDDEEHLVFVTKQILERLGYIVTATTKSREALRLFKEEPYKFDILITDYAMPEITGMELAGEVRSIRPDIPVILCTGFSENINEKRALEWGIRKFLIKPVMKQEISDAIREVFKVQEDV